MTISGTLRNTSIRLNHGSVLMPAAGFGTLIPDRLATKQATKTALEAGFRHFDCAERYRNEEAVGEAMQEAFKAGTVRREDVFVTTKLWNTNHRPERVKPAFDASRRRLSVDYIDCYIIHTPFAFKPGDEQDPRDEHGRVIYDPGVTLVETWRALERLVDEGTAGRSACQISPWRSCGRSFRLRGSSRLSCRWNPIRISPNGSCSTSAGSMGSCCKRSQRWDMPWNQTYWRIPVITAIAQRVAQDAGPSCPGLGRAARHRFPDHLDQTSAHPGEL